MEARGESPLLPENPLPYLYDWLFEIGPSSGDGPLSWQEMTEWCNRTGIELDPWEARTLRQASAEYLAERIRARKHNCPPPYGGTKDEIEDRRTVVDRKLQAAFSGLVGKKG